MIYFVPFLILGIVFLRRYLPQREPVFAALPRDKDSLEQDAKPWFVPGWYRDPSGNRISLRGRFIGYIDGTSMVSYGLPDGATIVGPRLDPRRGVDLKEDDIVVVRAPRGYWHDGEMLRCIEFVEDGFLHFKKDSKGRSHDTLPVSSAVAKIEHVID